MRPLRRVVAGNDAQGRSGVLYDSAVPNYFPRPTGTCFYELWTLDQVPTGIAGDADAGVAGRPFLHSPPADGRALAHHPFAGEAARGRIEGGAGQARRRERDRRHAALEGARHEGMHRTPSIDYAVCLEGERHLVLEDSTS